MKRRIVGGTLGAAAILTTVGAVYASVRPEQEAVDSLRAKVMAHEELIATCMDQAGFDYIPSLPKDVLLVEQEMLGGPDPKIPPNPNEQIYASLDATDQEAYATAYWGTESTPGCYDSTYRAAWAPAGELDDLEGKARQVEERMATDDAVAAAEQRYFECMTARGVDVEVVAGGVAKEIYDKAVELFGTDIADSGEVPSDLPGFDAYTAYLVTASEADAACRPAYDQIFSDVHEQVVDDVING